jgi:hypothetical protein
MDELVMQIVKKELQKLNTTFTTIGETNNSKRIKTSTNFIDCYRHIKKLLKYHGQYDGWDYTVEKRDTCNVILDASLYFNWPTTTNKEGYAFILTFESDHTNLYENTL